jgi:hypothetical protein
MPYCFLHMVNNFKMLLPLGSYKLICVMKIDSLTHQLLYPRDRDRGTHYIGGWMGPGAGLDVIEERKICCSYQNSNPVSPSS